MPTNMNNDNTSLGNNEAFCALIVGLISITTAFFRPVSAIVGGIVGIICAELAKRNNYTVSPRKAGLICSIAGLILGIISIVLWIAFIMSFFRLGIVDELMQEISDILPALAEL